MNAQRNFSKTLFTSFEIVDADSLKVFSLWGKNEHTITANDAQTRKLADFFYQLDGGDNFFEVCLFLAQNGGKITDFAEISESPIKFDEFLPSPEPDQWDFDAWKNALLTTLDEAGQEVFFNGLNGYFAEFFDGKTIFELCTHTGFSNLPVGSYLTNGDAFVQIVQQNGETTWAMSGEEPFALMAQKDLHPISAENVPSKVLETLGKYSAKWHATNEDNQNHVDAMLEKADLRAKVRAEKEATKAAKATTKAAEKAAKLEAQVVEAKVFTENSEILKNGFFQIDPKDMEAQKAYMVEHQKSMTKEDRLPCTELFKLNKAAADKLVKDAEKAEKEATKAAEKAAKDAAKAAEIAPETPAEVVIETVTSPATETPKKRRNAPTMEAAPALEAAGE